ncbi:unnamed protein product, partial [Prorocentrum cordatum]
VLLLRGRLAREGVGPADRDGGARLHGARLGRQVLRLALDEGVGGDGFEGLADQALGSPRERGHHDHLLPQEHGHQSGLEPQRPVARQRVPGPARDADGHPHHERPEGLQGAPEGGDLIVLAPRVRLGACVGRLRGRHALLG